MSDSIFSIDDLHVTFGHGEGAVLAADGVSLSVGQGEILGLVGESGSGKSASMISALRLNHDHVDVSVSGRVDLDGKSVFELSSRELRKLRSETVSVVFQDSAASLNPVRPVGYQLDDAVRAYRPEISGAERRAEAIRLFRLVGIPDPETRYEQYPHEFSGGMRQRAMIAMAVAKEPKLLVADEPTTALDATVQAQVLSSLIKSAQATGSGLVLITHDLGVIAEYADSVAVMYAGRIVEHGPVREVFASPTHPYTLGLLASIPRLDGERRPLMSIPGHPPTRTPGTIGCSFAPRCALAGDRLTCQQDDPKLTPVANGRAAACHFSDEMPDEIIRVESKFGEVVARPVENGRVARRRAASDAEEPGARERADTATDLDVMSVVELGKHYPIKKGLFRRTVGHVRAVDGVDLTLRRGETIGLVGESGSGKSTTARLLMNLEPATAGHVQIDGVSLDEIRKFPERKAFGRRVQIVFQDPFASLDPRQSVRELLAEPMIIHGMYDRAKRTERVGELLELVGLSRNVAGRRPAQFSGGQRQRIAIARALALEPEVLILDEPVSALDVSIQAQILNLLKRLQDQLGMAYLFISHDLGVVRQVSDQVLVMYLGKVMESGPTEAVLRSPGHPYTFALSAAVPNPNPYARGSQLQVLLEGEAPSPANPPSGCVFRTRCWRADEICARDLPTGAGDRSQNHLIACFHPISVEGITEAEVRESGSLK